MKGLRKMLLKEKKRLESILEMTRNQLIDAPGGTLQISKTGKWVQYYHYIKEENKGKKYISIHNNKLAQELAQKSYNTRILKLTEKRLAQINKILKDYDDDEMEKVFLREHKERQKLIKPVEPIWEMKVNQWLEQEYQKKGFQEGTPVILSERGERVRSKSEKILADYFYRHDIPYKYECPLHLSGVGVVYPDFTFLSAKIGQEVYWEHEGMIDEEIYAQNAVRKIHTYEKNGIYPRERLILTFETKKSILDTRMIEALVYRYL